MEFSLNRINFIILFFIVQIFHVCFVDARYPFIAAQVLNYTLKEYNNNTEIAIDSCASLTWIPLGKNNGNDCKTLKKDFLSDAVQEDELNLLEFCKGADYQSNGNFSISGAMFDMKTLHDKIYLCRNVSACKDDLAEEIEIEKVWKKVQDQKPSNLSTIRDTYKAHGNDSTKPFSSRMDIQHYIFENVKKYREYRQNRGNKDGKECVDRYGRKYPLPDDLGGCVMFQHKNPLTNKTELFMPMEKKDLVQYLSMYSSDHPLRSDIATLERLLPGNEVSNDSHNCLTLFIEDGLQMFVHCVYSPSDSDMFIATDYEAYFCPKEGEKNHTYPQSDSSYMYVDSDHILNVTRTINSSNFGFSKNCYISTKFSPKSVSNGIEVSLELKAIGSETSCSNFTLNANARSDEYAKTIKESMMEYCPWDDENTATVCFQVESKDLFVHYAQILDTVKTPILFDNCFFQNPTASNKCYYEVDTKNVSRIFRFPPRFIPKLEKNERISTDNAWSTTKEKEQHCGFVYLTNEDKQECYDKLLNMTESPIKDYTLDDLRVEFKDYNKSGKALICNCDSDRSPECETRVNVNKALDDHKDDLMCNIGNITDYHSVINGTIQPTPSDFFCLVKLTIDLINHQPIKKYEFSSYDLPVHIKDKDCPPFSELDKSLHGVTNTDAVIKGCWHDSKINVYHCCCQTSKEPCNTQEIIDNFNSIENGDARKAQQRINFGCEFNHDILTNESKTTCNKLEVRHNVLMRCYGVFKFTNATPKIVKESCYWPHPQYHDEYSIFCSKTFMDDHELADNYCFHTFVNDYTSDKEKKDFDRTLILCCNTFEYKAAKDKMLTRNVALL